MSALFSPLTLRSLTLPNRIVVSPMCQYSADDDGRPNAWHFTHINSLALSGAGMFCVEATAVESGGRITSGCLGLWNYATEAAFEPILAAVRKYSKARVAIQLAHAGRKASSHVPWKGGQQIPLSEGGWVADAPSAVPHRRERRRRAPSTPRGSTRIRNAFSDGAQRAARLGFDAIEVHAAHGYLLHEFLSPIANQRTDTYGGSLDNRMRFPLEVFEAVRAAFPAERPVGVRVSATDWVEGGWDVDQSVEFAKALKARGVDWVTASSGGVSPLQKIAAGPGYQVPFAERIKREAGVTTISVGLITEAPQAEEIIGAGKADCVALARGMLYDPRWGWHASAKLGATVEAPPQYWRSQPAGLANLFGEGARSGGR